MRSLVLLGTDTGVGKTSLAIGILRLAAERGIRLAPFKPIESGVPTSPGEEDSDARRLLEASRLGDLALADVSPYRLERPLSPHLAARLEGRVISTPLLLRQALKLLERHPALLIESAGGLLSPYGPAATPLSFARALARLCPLDAVLVTANRLGAINQASLAHLAFQHVDLQCAGVLLVDTTPAFDPSRETNAAEIASATGLPVLGRLPFLEPRLQRDPEGHSTAARPISAQAASAAVKNHLDLATILEGALLPRNL